MKEYLPKTASRTVGPYVRIGLAPDAAGFHIFKKSFGPVLITASITGERTIIEGRAIDGSGTPVRDALLEIQQANAAGHYNHPDDRRQRKAADLGFRGWGYTCSDFISGVRRFGTIKPGPVVSRDGHLTASYVNLWVVARGISTGLSTWVYFAGEREADVNDPVLNLIEWEVRRKTLIAEHEIRGLEVVYRFDIYLQGGNEAVSFDTQRPRR